MKGFIAAIFCVVAAAAVYLKREEILSRLSGDYIKPAPRAERGSPRQKPKFQRAPRFLQPVPASEEAYRMLGFPAVDSPWGLKQMTEFGTMVMTVARTAPESLPSSSSDYGVAVFRHVKSMTERFNTVPPDAMIQFGTAFDTAWDGYQLAGNKGYQYDKELALMAGLMARAYTEALVAMKTKYQRSRSTPVRNRSDTFRQMEVHARFSGLKELGRDFYDDYLKLMEKRQFLRPESRRLLASYLQLWFPDAGAILHLNYKGRIRNIREREDDPETARYLDELMNVL